MTKWQVIPGYEGRYEVNSAGQVRSTPRRVKHPFSGSVRQVGGKVLKPVKCRSKNIYYRLFKNGEYKDIAADVLLERANAAAVADNP